MLVVAEQLGPLSSGRTESVYRLLGLDAFIVHGTGCCRATGAIIVCGLDTALQLGVTR